MYLSYILCVSFSTWYLYSTKAGSTSFLFMDVSKHLEPNNQYLLNEWMDICYDFQQWAAFGCVCRKAFRVPLASPPLPLGSSPKADASWVSAHSRAESELPGNSLQGAAPNHGSWCGETLLLSCLSMGQPPTGHSTNALTDTPYLASVFPPSHFPVLPSPPK